MDKFRFFPGVVVILLGVLGALSCIRSPATRPPNIVLIIIDTLRADKLGSYGFKASVSPELDSLAQNGVRFERVVAQSSWTRPSIGSMLTSKFPRDLGLIKERWDKLPLDVTTVAEALKSAGYYSIGVTANPNINSFFNFDQGFDRYVDSQGVFGWMREQAGKHAERVTTPSAPDIFKRAMDEAIQAPDKPLYLQLNIMEVHAGRRTRRREVDADLLPLADSGYLQRVREASAAVGAFINQWQSNPKLKDTIFVITSDHGEGLQDHPDVPRSSGHGSLLYESQVLVPLIVHAPTDKNVRAGVVPQMVTLLDLMPTMLELAGAKAPAGMQGRSLVPLLTGKTMTALPYAYTETFRGKADKVGVYGTDWKFFIHRDNWAGLNPKELQAARQTENGARTDVKAKHPAEAKALDQKLIGWEHELKTPATGPSQEQPSKEEIERLESLGYLG